ncbi:MAG: dTMP kinase [Bacteriovoracaceae bacterium]|nr:dTMP kinase [Bacteriovoracaceae bacterium]
MTNDIPNSTKQLLRPPKNTSNSWFISFEGIEGAGKSTHIQRVASFLQNRGFDVILLREPGSTRFGEKLRTAILGAQTKLHPIAEAYLFAASRAQLLQEIILGKLEQNNTVVICDRFIDSSFAYQGIAGGLGIETIIDIHKHYPLCIVPHKTFYIRIDIETSLQRQIKRNMSKDYFESQGRDYYTKLIEGLDLASQLFTERIVTIDGQKSIDDVYQNIQNHLEKLLAK